MNFSNKCFFKKTTSQINVVSLFNARINESNQYHSRHTIYSTNNLKRNNNKKNK